MSEKSIVEEEVKKNIVSINSAAKQAVDSMEDGIKEVEQALGEEYATIRASVSHKSYKIVPCSLSKIAELVGHIKTFDTLGQQSQKDGKSEYDLICNPEWIGAITAIIKMSLHKDHNVTDEIIMDEFNMADFPIVFKEALKLNDFLQQMRGVNMMRTQK